MGLLRLASILALAAALHAQQTIGTVAPEDATITGNLSVTNGRTILAGNSSVTAKDHTAEIALTRGGTVLVCATSGLHLTPSSVAGAQPLMLALDRGAFELHTTALANDVVLTPDLRFAVQSGGQLDLRIRVTRNGDTCVDNKGFSAPTLALTDPFGDAAYQLRPNQHVLFEHGSLKEVVDHETSPCGCPEPTAPGLSIAEALLAPGTPPSTQAAAQHPFPAAISQGLAPPPPVPQAKPGQTHAQVDATLGYSADGSGNIIGTPTTATAPAPAVPLPSPAPTPSPKPGVGHRIGRFFKHLFGG